MQKVNVLLRITAAAELQSKGNYEKQQTDLGFPCRDEDVQKF